LGTYLTSYRAALTPTAPLLDQRNLIFRPLKFRARASVTWDHGPFSARVLANHVGGYINDVPTVRQEVDSYTPIDLSLTWRLGGDSEVGNSLFERVSLTLEVRNLFDVEPPYVNIAPSGNGSGGYDATAANPLGRVFGAIARVAF
jgi:iron complex outermembrane receptor protein